MPIEGLVHTCTLISITIDSYPVSYAYNIGSMWKTTHAIGKIHGYNVFNGWVFTLSKPCHVSQTRLLLDIFFFFLDDKTFSWSKGMFNT